VQMWKRSRVEKTNPAVLQPWISPCTSFDFKGQQLERGNPQSACELIFKTRGIQFAITTLWAPVWTFHPTYPGSNQSYGTNRLGTFSEYQQEWGENKTLQIIESLSRDMHVLYVLCYLNARMIQSSSRWSKWCEVHLFNEGGTQWQLGACWGL
jgi:hypothetical protein